MTVVGDGDFRFERDETWPNIPEGWELGLCSDVAVDSRERVHVFTRGVHPIVIFDAESGNFISSWGEGEFNKAHGIHIGPDDSVYLSDRQAHIVTKHSSTGEKLLELGKRDYAQTTVDSHGNHGAPFNQPTGVALNPEGKIFCSDGYGNFRAHRFSAEGELEFSWGIPGTRPGEFALLHQIAIDPRGRVLIADRENQRVQLFNQDGEYIEEWTSGLRLPGAFHIAGDAVYVVEQYEPSGVSVFDLDGNLITRWTSDQDGILDPHGISGDAQGNLYIAEIGSPGTGQRVSKLVKV